MSHVRNEFMEVNTQAPGRLHSLNTNILDLKLRDSNNFCLQLLQSDTRPCISPKIVGTIRKMSKPGTPNS